MQERNPSVREKTLSCRFHRLLSDYWVNGWHLGTVQDGLPETPWQVPGGSCLSIDQYILDPSIERAESLAMPKDE